MTKEQIKDEANNEMYEKFDKIASVFEIWQTGDWMSTGDLINNDIENIINTYIDKAFQEGKKEEREEIIKDVQLNYKGTFRDDAGNDCWYIDDLVKHLTKLYDNKRFK
jgi:hypothetical protein